MKTKIEFIAIPYVDSDFYNTTYNLLRSILNVIEWREEFELETLTKIIKDGIGWHYWAFQDNEADKDTIDHVSNYLSKIEILFNTEAYNATLNNNFCEGWFVDVKQKMVTKF